MTRPNCYECKYRGTVPGDCHSCCRHPKVKSSHDTFAGIVDAMLGKDKDTVEELNIMADVHGVRSGWFFWPVNFDPTWLLSCSGFTPVSK